MTRIRPLQDGDEPEWMRMRFALWPDYTIAAMQDEMAMVRADERQPVFVAEAPNGTLCGLVEVAIHTSAPGCHSQCIGYLEAWYVDPAWRGLGIGRALAAVAETWSYEQGCREMASDTNPSYPLSPPAHARLGYETVARLSNGDLLFRKDLSRSKVLHPQS